MFEAFISSAPFVIGIRVNSVSPTSIDTPRNRPDMPGADFSAGVKPEAFARTMLSLATEEAAAVSGADVLWWGVGERRISVAACTRYPELHNKQSEKVRTTIVIPAKAGIQ